MFIADIYRWPDCIDRRHFVYGIHPSAALGWRTSTRRKTASRLLYFPWASARCLFHAVTASIRSSIDRQARTSVLWILASSVLWRCAPAGLVQDGGSVLLLLISTRTASAMLYNIVPRSGSGDRDLPAMIARTWRLGRMDVEGCVLLRRAWLL